MLKITYIDESDVFNYDTNNHSIDIDGTLMTKDLYFDRLKKTEMDNWVHLVYKTYQIYDLNAAQLKILTDASYVGGFSQKVSNLYKEQLEEIAKDIDKKIQFDRRYFVRLNTASPKDSEFFEYEIRNGWDVIRQLATSHRANRGFSRGVNRIYFVPFRQQIANNPEFEFRVFVRNSKITAISQYQFHTDKKLYELGDLNKILQIAETLNEPYLDNLDIEDYVIDMWIDFVNIDGIVIEINSFGQEMAAGSCLFHWIKDQDQLYGKTGFVELRLTLVNQGSPRFTKVNKN